MLQVLQTVALVGHSFGSLIALEAAARDAAKNPNRINHLALLGTAVADACICRFAGNFV